MERGASPFSGAEVGPRRRDRVDRRGATKKGRPGSSLRAFGLQCGGGAHLHHIADLLSRKWRRSAATVETYRLFSCAECQALQAICARCDHGQRVCRACSPERRRRSVLRAGARYQGTRRGRRLHAVRQARHRARKVHFLAQIVTHPSSTQALAEPITVVVPETISGGKDRDASSTNAPERCCRCGALLPSWARAWAGPHPDRRARRTKPRRARPPRYPP